MKSWYEYWNRPNGIFVSESHKRAHYQRIFSNVLPFLPRGPGGAVLDWGCGEASAAELMASACERVYLYDSADIVHTRLRQRYEEHRGITVLDAERLKRLPSDSLDLILINSVIQYLSRAQLIDALFDLRRLLKPGGRVLIGDVIAPGTQTWQHAMVFLTFAYRSGFMVSGIIGLFRTFLPSYNSVKRQHGLAKYSETEILNIFELCELHGERLPRNIAVSPIRSSYIASKKALASDR
jgi:ubiquinone/menaquinone biosynthesis C-methylase UbiE